MSVEDLFAWFASRYGRRFADMWSGIDPERVKQAWREELAGFGPEDIARGLAACRAKDWPPSAPEFRNACRPVIDYEASFVEAAHQWRNRQYGTDAWSHPAIFWAAAAIGNDVTAHPYRWMANRWRVELDRSRADIEAGRLPREIPPRRVALPPVTEVIATGDQVRQCLGGGQ